MAKRLSRKFSNKKSKVMVPAFANDELLAYDQEEDSSPKIPNSEVGIRRKVFRLNSLVKIKVDNGSVRANIREVKPTNAVKIISGMPTNPQFRKKKLKAVQGVDKYNREAVRIMNSFLEFEEGKFLKSRVAQRLAFLGNILEYNFSKAEKYSGSDLVDFERFKSLNRVHRNQTIYALRLYFDSL